jgi:maleylacetate reductase
MKSLSRGVFNIQAQERVVFGQPASEAVQAEAKRYGARRIFVTSTRSLARLESGPLHDLVEALGPLCVGTHTEISSHSPREDVIAGANAARAARADLLVALGGGSVIDATKAMQLCLWLGLESPAAMEPYHASRDREPIKIASLENPIRMIAVSTTLSASDFTSTAGVTDSATKSKQSFAHRLLAPRVVVLDPAATLHTPLWLLFATGIRSVDHAVEGYCSPAAHAGTEALSLQGLRLLSRALPAMKADPADLQARLEAQMGMWQAIAPGASGVPNGASHGIGYVLGGTFGVPHGHTSCVMLPAVLAWNAAVNGERQKALSEAMGAPQLPASRLIKELISNLDQPTSLRDVGIKRENLPEIAERALGYAPVLKNPRPIKTAAEVMEILELAW